MEPMEEPRLPEPSRRTLVAALSVAAERFGEAHIDFDIGGRIAYAALDEQSTRAAAGLAAVGGEGGDRVLGLGRPGRGRCAGNPGVETFCIGAVILASGT